MDRILERAFNGFQNSKTKNRAREVVIFSAEEDRVFRNYMGAAFLLNLPTDDLPSPTTS
jgi:hypothetical protein